MCGRLPLPGEAGGGVVKRIFRRERGVETNLEVRVRFPSRGMEVIVLWGHGFSGGRSEREARRDESGPVV